MKRPYSAAICLIATLLTGGASAMTPFLQIGSDLTLGSTSHHQPLVGSLNNPAAAASLRESNKSVWRFGGLHLATRTESSGEGGDDRIGAISTYMDILSTSPNDIIDTFSNSVEAILFDDAKGLINDAAKDGHLHIAYGGHLPMMPMVLAPDWTTGAITLDVDFYTQGTLGVLESPVVLNPISNEMQMNTAVSISANEGVEFGVGYSHRIWSGDTGALYAGSKVRMIQISFSKMLAGFDNSDDVGLLYQGAIEQNGEPDIGVDLDAGLLWLDRYYQIGITVNNLLESEFHYPEIGFNCSDPTLTVLQQTTCVIAVTHLASMGADIAYTMNRLVSIEGAVYSRNRHWVASVSYDLGLIEDTLGNAFQNLVASGSYHPDSIWVPGFRIGYRKNQVGSALSEVMLGLSWFRVSLDLAQSTQSVTAGDGNVPRSYAFSVGIDFTF